MCVVVDNHDVVSMKLYDLSKQAQVSEPLLSRTFCGTWLSQIKILMHWSMVCVAIVELINNTNVLISVNL